MGGPANDFMGMTAQVASGAVVGVMSTGQGRGSDLPLCPWLMVASNTTMFNGMRGDMDINAGGIVEGTHSVKDVGQEIFRQILATANGEKTAGEKLGLDNVFSLFTPGATT